MQCVMVKVLSFGLMVHVMRASGRTTKPTVKESLCTLMETCMKVNGSMTKLKVMELIRMQMERSMKEAG